MYEIDEKCRKCKNNQTAICYRCDMYYGEFEPIDKLPETNYDRFKTMSIDELENTLLLEICELTGMSEYEDDGINKRTPLDCPLDCRICLHEWLKQEVSE